MKIRNHVDFAHYEARNAKAHVLGGDPSLSTPDGGHFWWDSGTKLFRGWDGTAALTLTNLIESVAGAGALSANLVGKTVTLSIAAASGSVPGTMSAADKTKLDASTASNTPSTLVFRDGSGGFAAGDITAHLVGLADNSTLLNGQTLAQVRDFNQTTGTRDHTAISDFDTQVRTNHLNQLGTPTAPLDLNSQRLTNGADPTSAQDLATKNYVDSVATGLTLKGSVRLATAAPLPACTYANGTGGVGATLTANANGALGNIDGVAAALNNRILVKNQVSQPQDGLYIVTDAGSGGTPWILTRTTDADSNTEVTPGMFTFVEEGSTLAKTGWALSATGVITIGTTALPFTQFSGAGTYSAGNGLSLTGSTFTAVGTTNRISVGGSGIDIDSAYVGQASITTLGTVATGTWNATTIAVAKGGTGATAAAAARTNLGAMGRNAIDIPAGSTYSFNHGLGTLDVIAAVVEVASGDVVYADVTIVDANHVSITFGASVSSGAYRVIVIG